MKSPRFILFVLFSLVCVSAPLGIIWKYENTLRAGTQYKLRTEPVDPYDAFRGRYVRLSFVDRHIKTDKDSKWLPYGEGAYIRLKVGEDGFAKPVEVSATPLTGEGVLRVDITYPWQLPEGSVAWIYPFSRFYLPEDVAPLAEKLYADATRRGNVAKSPGETYATVRIRDGVGVIEDLFINGKPVREAIQAELQKRQNEQNAEPPK